MSSFMTTSGPGKRKQDRCPPGPAIGCRAEPDGQKRRGAPSEHESLAVRLGELEAAEHIHELSKGDTAVVNIDWGQRGVGGDLPGALCLMEKYRMPAGREYSYSFILEKG